MNVKEIVSLYLKGSGYTGLLSDSGDCGCGLEDLAPCDGTLSECAPGYKVPCTCEDHDGWHVQLLPEEASGGTA